MSEPIKVLIVDDQELVRVGFRLVLEAEPGIEVVGEAADGAGAIARAVALRPAVVLMDVRMPCLDGVAATRRILSEVPGCRVVVLTTFDLDEYAFGAIQAGASGFLLKDATRHELTAAVRAVDQGDAVLAPSVTRRLLERFEHLEAHRPAGTDPADGLTEREREVFLAMAEGLTNTEIARRLYLSESTVKTHVGRVMAKVGARDRVQAVILAHRWGHVATDGPGHTARTHAGEEDQPRSSSPFSEHT